MTTGSKTRAATAISRSSTVRGWGTKEGSDSIMWNRLHHAAGRLGESGGSIMPTDSPGAGEHHQIYGGLREVTDEMERLRASATAEVQRRSHKFWAEFEQKRDPQMLIAWFIPRCWREIDYVFMLGEEIRRYGLSFERRHITALSINGIIGAGIFGLPAAAAGLLGFSSPVGFLLCGLIVYLFVLCFAEAASHFVDSGGPYLYSRTAFGSRGRQRAVEVADSRQCLRRIEAFYAAVAARSRKSASHRLAETR